jgi:hypothetical protein
LNEDSLDQLRKADPLKFAIIIPAWDEGCGDWQDAGRKYCPLEYPASHFFFDVGQFVRMIRRPSMKWNASPELHANVKAVVSPVPGPTSKGQILNHVTKFLVEESMRTSESSDAIVLHDAERSCTQWRCS